MKCSNVDLLAVLDGRDPESEEHLNRCDACRKRASRLKSVLRLAERAYGRALVEEATQAETGEETREALPRHLQRRIESLRRERIMSELTERLGMTLEAARRMVDRMLNRGESLPSAMPASPKRLVFPDEKDLQTEDDPDRDDDQSPEEEGPIE